MKEKKNTGYYHSEKILDYFCDKRYGTYLGSMLINMADSNYIVKNKTSLCSTWRDIYEVIGLTNNTKASNFKRWLTENDLVREVRFIHSRTGKKKKKMMFNPCLLKRELSIKQEGIEIFYDYIIKNANKFIPEMDEKHETRGYVYILEDELGRIKIGLSKTDLKRRIRCIQTASGLKVIKYKSIFVEDCSALERSLHYKYKDNRTLGEWFINLDYESFENIIQWENGGDIKCQEN